MEQIGGPIGDKEFQITGGKETEILWRRRTRNRDEEGQWWEWYLIAVLVSY